MHDPMPPSGLDPEHLDPLCSLDDANRRRLYTYVAAEGTPVTRDDASDALGIDRSLVAYHLDRLVDEGLLVATFARPDGRAGPGAGRPAKHYARADREFSVSLPPRDYRLAGEILARAAEIDPTGIVRAALERAAAELGGERGSAEVAAPGDLHGYLVRAGFEPYDDDGVIRLRNCPMHQLAQEHTEIVCRMNLAMLTQVAAALGAPYETLPQPGPGRCCVAFEARP